MNEDLYAVVIEMGNDIWEVDIRILGIYDNIEEAEERKEKAEKLYSKVKGVCSVRIDKFKVNRDCDVYIGGYIE